MSRKEYDRESSDSDYDGTRGGRPSLFASTAWSFPTLTSEAGVIGFEVVLHTGSDPDVVANRKTAVRRIADPTALDAILKFPSAKVGTATVNASVRAVFTFGKGAWATSGTPGTQSTGTVVIPGIVTVATTAAPAANGLVIAGSGTTIALAKTSETTDGGLAVGAHDLPSGTKTFTGNVALKSGAGLGITFSDGTTQTTAATAGSAISSLTGDVTATGPGAAAATIAADAVTNSKLANMATLTVKANITGGTTDPSDVGLSAFGTAIGPFVAVTGIPPTSVTFSPGDALMFGAGTDGDLASGFGTYSFFSPSFGTTRTTEPFGDRYFRNVTLGPGDKLVIYGWRCFISGTLDISNADAGAISMNAVQTISGSGGGGVAAGNGSTSSGGAAGTAFGGTGGPFGGTSSGGAGGNSNVGNGSAGGGGAGPSGSTGAVGNGGRGGQGGPGGNGSGGNTGGTSPTRLARSFISAFIPGQNVGMARMSSGSATLIGGGFPGTGGGGGGGSGTQTGGGGGGGASGAGVVCLFAATIARGTNTNTGIITARGGDGGNGASATNSNTGGGGGGAGGGGGWLMLGYKALTGSVIANAIDYSGGAGGNGGNGNGTGSGGDGGGSGDGGLFILYDMNTGTCVNTGPTAGSAGGAHSGTTGGTGASTNLQRSNL